MRQLLVVVFSLFLANEAFAQPTLSKVFTPNIIGPGSVSTITLTITNASASPVTALAFTDTLPGDVAIADPANVSTTCDLGVSGTLTAPDGGGVITLSDAQIGGLSVCTITVDVTASAFGVHTNPAVTLNSSAGSSMSLPIDLTVSETLPGFSKSFAPASVSLGGRSTLTFTINNGLNDGGGVDIGSLDFTDIFPVGMEVADPSNAATDCISPGFLDTTLTAVSGSNMVILDANGSTIFPGLEVLAGGDTCTVSVDVKATADGELDNVSGELLADFVSAGKASDTLEVTVTPIAIQKSFTDDPTPPGGTVTLRFVIDNFDRDFSATGVAFTDDLTTALAGLTFASLSSNDCGGSVSGVGTTDIIFTGGTIAPESFCAIEVSLTVPAATPGIYTNTTGAVTATVDGSPVVGNTASDDLFVSPAPVLTKEFLEDGTLLPDPVVDPGSMAADVVLRFTITNTSTTSMATDVAFDDELTDASGGSPPDTTSGFLPFPVTVTSPALPAPACGGTLAFYFPDTDRQGLRLTGGSLAAAGMSGDSCSFDVTVTIPQGFAPGVYLNTTEEPTATVDGATRTGKPASDTLTVIGAPTLTKSFTDDPVGPGGTVTLEFTLTHGADASTDATDITFTDDLAALVPPLAGLTATGLPIVQACDPDGPGGNPGTGTLSGSAGDTLLTFMGGTLSPGESCTFSISLDVPALAAPGTYTNTSSGVGATVAGEAATSPAAEDDLKVTGLVFTKEFLTTPVIAGDTTTLRFTIDNIHPTDDATIIFFTDSLTTGLAGLAATGPASFNDCGGTLSGTTFLTYVGGSILSPGTMCTIEVEVLVPLGAADGDYTNTTSSLSATQVVTVVIDPAIDVLTVNSNLLQLTKEFTDDPVSPGDPVTLEFILTNLDAAQAASGVGFSDDLSAILPGTPDLTFDSVLFDDCGGTVGGTGTDMITVSAVSLGVGGSCTLRVSLTVPGGTPGGVYTNTTSDVSGTIGGFAVTGDAVSDDLEVIQLLTFSKSFDGPTTATGAAVLTFTITNPGTDTATGLGFTDDLSAVIPGLVATSVPAVPCGAGSSITGVSFLTFSGGELPPMGGTCTFDVDVMVPAGVAAGTFPNTTSELFQNGLEVSEPATADLTIEPPPTFAKVFMPDTILAGGVSTLRFTIDNGASAVAVSSFTFTDGFPAGVFIADPTNASTTCAGMGDASVGASSFTFAGGSIAAGASCTIDVDVTSIVSGMHVNTTGDLTSSSGNSGTASDTLTVNPAADLSVTKTDGVTSVNAGESVTYTIVVSNSGPSVDPSASVTDTFPADLSCTYGSTAAGGATGNTASATPVASLAETLSMPASSSVTYTVSCAVDPGASGTLSNTATVSASVNDANSANDSATDNTDIERSTDLAITKTDGVTTAVPGQDTLIYTIVATNIGPSEDPGAFINDSYPAGLSCTVTSQLFAGGATLVTDFSNATQLQQDLFMPPASTVTYTVTCSIDSAATGLISNEAYMRTASPDPDMSNNDAFDETTLEPEVDISVTKDDGVMSATPGGSVTYTIVAANAGPSDDPAVSLTDTFPADLSCTYGSTAAGGATGNTTSATPVAGLAETLSMPTGSSVTYTVSCDIDAGATGTLSNTATATESIPGSDSDGGNNSATDNDTVLNPEVDISVTKDDGVMSATPGGSVTYTIVAANAGPSDDPAVSLTDTFPADLSCTYGSTAAGGATGNTTSATPVAGLAETLSMPTGSSVTYTVSCDIDAGATGTLSNTATATESIPGSDSNGGNNSATDETTLEPDVDISVTKDDGVVSATPGGSVTYTIVAANAGPSDDPAVSLTDTFPADLSCTYGSTAAGGATGNTTSATPVAGLAETLSMPSGSSVTYTVSCDIDAGATGTLSNTATATESIPGSDSNGGNNSATDNDTVLNPDVDISVTKDDGVVSATPGGSVTYTIVAANAGPSDDPAVSLTDTFPADLSCTYGSTAAGGATGNTTSATPVAGLAETLSMPSGSSVTYTVSCDIDAGATGTLSNTAMATESIPGSDSNGGNNSATDETTLEPDVDISVTKDDGVVSATPGGSVTYTIVAANAGPSDDPAVSLTDTFPADLSCTYGSTAAGGATGNTTSATPVAGLAETLSMPTGSSVTYTVSCDIDAGATGTLSNTAMATESIPGSDSDGGNNSATDNDTVLNPEVDISVTKDDGVMSATPGGSVTYTIVAANAGPSDDPAVSLTDTFPADLSCTYGSTAAGGATGNTTSATPVAGLAETLSMPTGSSVTYTVSCDIDAGATGTLSNTATATESIPGSDSDGSNNSATDDDTNLEQLADIGVTKTDGVTTAVPGQTTLTYIIVASNAGPSDDPSVSLTDTLPTDLSCTWSSVATAGVTGNTTTGAGDLAESLSMPTGSSVTYTVVCDIDPGAIGTLLNTAMVSGSIPVMQQMAKQGDEGNVVNSNDKSTTELDNNNSNNSATDDDTVLTPETDLSIIKSSDKNFVNFGSNLTYTLVVTNDGPSDSTGGTVTDILPSGLSFVSSPDCTEAAGTVTCPVGPLTVGDIQELTFVALVTLNMSSTLENTASVSGNETDPDGNNDSSVAATTVWPVFAPIPTLSGWMLILMIVLFAGIGIRLTRRASLRV